jgi:hypothetical protein
MMIASDMEPVEGNDNDTEAPSPSSYSTSQTPNNSQPKPKHNDKVVSPVEAIKSQRKPESRRPKNQANLTVLRKTLSQTEEKLNASIDQLQSLSTTFPSLASTVTPLEKRNAVVAHAKTIVNDHIAKLNRYNEIKDIALGLLNLIAEREGRRLADVMEERGLSETD